MESSEEQPKKGYSLKQLLSHSLIYSSSDLMIRLFGLFLIPVYTRVLTPSDYGIVGVANAFTQMLSPIVGIGIVGSLPAFYYRYEGEERNRFISSAVNFAVLYSIVLLVGLIAVGLLKPDLFSKDVPFFPYIFITTLGIFFLNLYFLPLGIFNITNSPKAYGLYSAGLALLGIVANILFVVLLKMGALGTVLANLASGVAGFFVVIWVLRKYYVFCIDRDKLKVLFLFCLPTLPHLLSSNIWKFADRFFLLGMTSLADTGLYSLASTYASALLILIMGATNSLNPHFFQRAQKDDPALPGDWSRIATLFFFASGVLATWMAFIATEIFQILTPSKYHGASAFIPLLIVGQLFTGLYMFQTPAIGHTRKTWVYPIASVPTVIFNLCLNQILIPKMGAEGATLSLAASAVLQFFIFSSFSQKYFKIPYEYSKLLQISCLLVIYYFTANLIVTTSPWSSLILKSASLFPFLGLMLFLGLFTADEIHSAKKYLLSKIPAAIKRALLKSSTVQQGRKV